MSKVPDALEAVFNIIELVHPTVKLLDGPGDRVRANEIPDGVWPDQDVIVVGWTPAGPGVTVTPDLAGLGKDREEITIFCFISCIGGDLTIKPLRTRAFGLYDPIAARIAQDRTLAHNVTGARMSAAAVTPFLNPDAGAAVELTFTISCTAFA